MKHLQILGTRGIPARHGGFETFAERLARYLVERSWNVTVYCQASGTGSTTQDTWHGVRRVIVPVSSAGAAATMAFDLKSTLHAMREQGTALVLGYNTAVFEALPRLRGKRIVMNMDGIEWKRDKWSTPERAWLRMNEFLGARFAHRLVADHPEIASHLVRSARVQRDKIRVIPYGADPILAADQSLIEPLGLRSKSYSLVVARPEPENSILEIVTAFSRRHRNHRLAVLGEYLPDTNRYHRSVIDAASSEVLFPGAIYDHTVVRALRFHARLYLHGHTVGGTNPSLVEAMGAGDPILAHDNVFNRWVAGSGALYFSTMDECEHLLSETLNDPSQQSEMAKASRRRHSEAFRWDGVLAKYEALLENST